MESDRRTPTAAEAAVALRDAEAARATLAADLGTPSWLSTSMSVAIALQIALTATGLGVDRPWLVVAGLALFAVVAGVHVVRFRRVNGVRLGGFVSRVVLGAGTSASTSYTLALAAAIWAALAGRWGLMALWAAGGGAAYALSGRRWMRGYRLDPASHARGESLAWLVLGAAAAAGGLAMLVLNA